MGLKSALKSFLVLAILAMVFPACSLTTTSEPSFELPIKENGSIDLTSDEKKQLADEVMSNVISESEKIWNRKLDKQIRLTLKTDGSEIERQYPMLWFDFKIAYYLTLHEDFDLEATWWNMQPDNEKVLDFFRHASLRQKYILVISHEVSHLFMSSAPMKPWFQEAAAMNIGKHIAITIDPLLIDAFPEPKTKIDTDEIFDFTYQDMIDSIELCRKIQYESYSLTHDVPITKVLDWVENVSKNIDYDDEQIYDKLSK